MPGGGRRAWPVERLTNISRGPGAWNVVVVRQGRRCADYFPDAVWGGRERALVAAQRFRDRVLMRVEPDTRVRRRVPKGVRSATGFVGVSLEAHVVGGHLYQRYVACWREPDKGTRRRRFLVQCYGREQALALAVEARVAGVARVRAELRARQRAEARRRLQEAPPLPAQVRDPLSRKGISMARRRPRVRASP